MEALHLKLASGSLSKLPEIPCLVELSREGRWAEISDDLATQGLALGSVALEEFADRESLGLAAALVAHQMPGGSLLNRQGLGQRIEVENQPLGSTLENRLGGWLHDVAQEDPFVNQHTGRIGSAGDYQNASLMVTLVSLHEVGEAKDERPGDFQ